MPPYFAASSLLAWGAVVGAAFLVRGRFYATFAAVVLGIHTLVSVGQAPRFDAIWPFYVYLQVCVYAHFLSLGWPALRPWPYRAFVSVPASWFVAGTFLAWPWALLGAFGFQPWAPWLPYLLALAGVVESLYTREEDVDVVLDGKAVPHLSRAAHGSARTARPLRIVQITDPHLGPFMSVQRLRRICERAVAKNPDLVLLTGDFLTMESQGDDRHLSEALAPLRDFEGRVFACRGNHDLEAPEVVARACESARVRLLVDELVRVETGAGPVDILGIDFRFNGRAAHISSVTAAHPRTDGAIRVVALHDPGAFKHVPDGAADLVLSGHTHGGQLGLLWLGLETTVVSALTSLPDHGYWALGVNRLYVHRGTGHYGFPLRIGVPAERSVLSVHRQNGAGEGLGLEL
jgi:predicted MPP superfamily phosphohydrolase